MLRLVSVGSKRFLTTKVDRSVTGLIAQQQCVGPLQLTVADVAVIAQSHFGTTGAAIAIGEQPIKGLVDPAAMGRMAVGEALTNLVWARVSALEDIKCSANWMWAAKLPGEGAALYDAAAALCELMLDLGIAVDGGKDSLSMAAHAPGKRGAEETVKAPGALVISAYATCPDITQTVTPDLGLPGSGRLLYVDLGAGQHRLGGSALAHVFGQVGDESPDVDDAAALGRAFGAVQQGIAAGAISAGHVLAAAGVGAAVPFVALVARSSGLLATFVPRVHVRGVLHRILARVAVAAGLSVDPGRAGGARGTDAAQDAVVEDRQGRAAIRDVDPVGVARGDEVRGEESGCAEPDAGGLLRRLPDDAG